jgi:CubicO group peptidase (beta-lactamase class C family)
MVRLACTIFLTLSLVLGPRSVNIAPASEPHRSGQTAAEQRRIRRLERAFDHAVAKAGMKPTEPGVIVAVVEGGEPIFQRWFGLANVEKRSPIGPRTTFELASDTKMMTGYALLMLVERGRLKLGDDVQTYLPEFPDFGPKHRIRVRDLVHHTSGLPEYFDLEPEHGGRSYVTNADFGRNFSALKEDLDPTFIPGSKYDYCNTNYMLLGLIIERVTGESYGRFVKKNVFEPFGMKGAWVNERPRLAPRDPTLGYVNAVGYSREDDGSYTASWGAYPDREEELLTVGDGSIWCNIEDMIQWSHALREHKGLSTATWRLAITPTHFPNGKINDYGFGLSLEFDDDGELSSASHDGSWGGFLTSFDWDVTDDRAIIILSNRGDLDLSEFIDALTAAL